MADKPLPVPLRDWVLVRKEKKGGGLILPDAVHPTAIER